MIETLEQIDRWIVSVVNSWNSSFLDELMWLISAKFTWVPLYVLLVFLYYFKSRSVKKTLLFFLSAVFVVVLCDQISVHLFKEFFMRYRPSHNGFLTDTLHFYQMSNGEPYKGGTYGFVSSHAANLGGLVSFSILGLRSQYKWIGWMLFSVLGVVMLSRIYLGVHYLSDVIAGAILGFLIGYVIYRFVFVNLEKRLN